MGINIDFRMLPMKAHYFLYNAGTGAVVPYMPVMARQLGISTFVVGVIYAILPILGLISKPLFGALADRYQRHKTMFVFFILLTLGAFSSIQFIPSIPKNTKLQFNCNDAVADLKYCPSSLDHCAADSLLNSRDNNETANREYKFDLRCDVTDEWMWDVINNKWNNVSTNYRPENNIIEITSYVKANHIEKIGSCIFFTIRFSSYQNQLSKWNVTCPKTKSNNPNHTGAFKLPCTGTVDDENVMNLIVEPSVNDGDVTGYAQFWYFCLALSISWIGMAVVVSVGDAICFDLLGKRFDLYGRQRSFGAIGFGLFSLLSGFLVDAVSGQKAYKHYSVIYYLMAVALLPNTLITNFLEFKPNKTSTSIIRDIGKLFKSARIIVFFLWCIAVGLCTALIWNFLFWHLEVLADQKEECSYQERIKTLQGMVTGIQSFGGELPFFFISGWFINKFGHNNCMTLVLFTFGIRLFLYSVLSNPWWVLPIELMQGITFGIFYTAMATYANIVAPHGTSATLQGLVGAIFEGIGVSSGSLLGGYFMKEFGGSITFRVFGIGAVCLSVVHHFVHRFMDDFLNKHDYRSAAYFQPDDDFQMLEDNDFY